MDGEDTRERLLRAAANEFIRSGYACASVGLIAQQAGISKKTIYVHFESKHALFVAAVRERLRMATISDTLIVADRRSPARVLQRFLREVLDLGLSSEGRAVYRLVMSEARSFAELMQTYSQVIEDSIVVPLSAWLQQQSEGGELAIPAPRLYAAMLVQMVLSEPLRDTALGKSLVPTASERTHLVRSAVELFLNGTHLRQGRRSASPQN